MKVVLFCGGLGTRLREFSQNLPKPMVKIGYRPILWHIMKYYAHYGHKDFILCLGYKADVIKDYFLNYNECVSNDFTMLEGGRSLQLLNSDIHDWKITFVDTGLTSSIGQRFKAVEKHLNSEEMFLVNYSDGLTDLHLPEMIQSFEKQDKIASFLCTKPSHSFHIVTTTDDGIVKEIKDVQHSDIRINGGYFVFRRDIFDYIQEGEDLVYEPFQRLIEKKQLVAYNYDGFWGCMDTFKEQQQLDDMYVQGKAPWEVWKRSNQAEKKFSYSSNNNYYKMLNLG